MGEREGSNGQGRSSSLSPDQSLNLVLIGEREAGKSAVGNAILGTMDFDQVGVRTRTSVRRQGLVRGRRVVVVDTPGWEWFNMGGRSATPGAVRKEMVASVTLCRPGVHVLLLVVPLSFSFSARERRVVEDHVELFGPGTWNHTLVIFTVKDSKVLRTHSLQEEVEGNKELQKLVGKCSGRYHALYGGPSRVENQVSNLMTKIQNLVSANGESVLLSNEVLELAQKREQEEERREEEERKEREETVRRVRESLRMERGMRHEEESRRRERIVRREMLDGSGRPDSSASSTANIANFWNVCKTQ